ncbi:Hypothetical protein NTJ_11264 [Nesidiocoris tenuis]|nr:Hypothetical protein NTJ_11264 [Nesidiocoris tenuis]
MINQYNVFLPGEHELGLRVLGLTHESAFVTAIPGVSKSNQHHLQAEAKTKTMEFLERYKNHVQIYTDGAKNDQGVGSAFYCNTHKLGTAIRQHDITSSYNAEIIAIEMALEHVLHSHAPDSEIVILSDSKSAIAALKKMRIGDAPPTNLIRIHQLLRVIQQQATKTVIQWVISHCGIPLNELVDKLAVRACQRENVNCSTTTYYEDCKGIIQDDQDSKWQHSFADCDGAGSWTRAVINHPLKMPWFKNRNDFDNRTISTINRILIGHGRTNSFLAQMKKRDIPTCDRCDLDEEQNMQHLLLRCRHTTSMLQQIFAKHSVSVPINPGTLTDLHRFLRECVNTGNMEPLKDVAETLSLLDVKL